MNGIPMELLAFAAAQVLALALAYARLTAKVSNLEGQLIHVLRQIDKADDLSRDLDLLDRAQIKTAMDVDHAFDAIRRTAIEIKFLQDEEKSADNIA